VYQYLADSIEEFPSGAAMQAILGASGFHPEMVLRLQGGIVTIHTGQTVDKM
jgi:ubiquinone/menaquinone biosynthesis C-methylase UbiE